MGDCGTNQKHSISRMIRHSASSKSRRSYFSIAYVAWLLPSVFLLGWALYPFLTGVGNDLPPAYKSERVLVMELWMLALTFPCGLLWLLLVSGIAYAFPYLFSITLGELTVLSIFLTWLSFFICGYFQWYKLLPWIIRKLHSSVG